MPRNPHANPHAFLLVDRGTVSPARRSGSSRQGFKVEMFARGAILALNLEGVHTSGIYGTAADRGGARGVTSALTQVEEEAPTN